MAGNDAYSYNVFGLETFRQLHVQNITSYCQDFENNY